MPRLLTILLCAAAAARADNVDAYIQSQIETRHIPGMSIAVVKNGEPVKIQGYGLADVENRVAATPETVYLLASVTKQFTATAVMMLAGDGKLRIEDKIAQYLPGAPNAWK